MRRRGWEGEGEGRREREGGWEEAHSIKENTARHGDICLVMSNIKYVKQSKYNDIELLSIVLTVLIL